MFGFGLNLLDVMSFFYLFIPTWFFTIVVYTVLAARCGAKQDFTEEKVALTEFEQRVQTHQQREAAALPAEQTDRSGLSRILRLVSVASLLVTVGLAVHTFTGSPSMNIYEQNRDIFFNVGFGCTVLYFLTAYWTMRRQKALTAQ